MARNGLRRRVRQTRPRSQEFHSISVSRLHTRQNRTIIRDHHRYVVLNSNLIIKRMFSIFSIFSGYPESFPSVKDLQDCLCRTQLKPVLTQSLKCTLEARLLHQGATTEDILIAYVSAIRAFSVLDPTGVLLDVACDPIKYSRYLYYLPIIHHIFI